MLHQILYSPIITFFFVLTMGACLYSALLFRHSSPLSWWFFIFIASCITRDIGSLCWDNTVTLNLAGSPLCLVVWWVCMNDLSDFLEYAFWCSFPRVFHFYSQEYRQIIDSLFIIVWHWSRRQQDPLHPHDRIQG